MKIGTRNSRSVFASGKLNNNVKEMLRLNVDILGVRDVIWPGSGSCATSAHSIILGTMIRSICMELE